MANENHSQENDKRMRLKYAEMAFQYCSSLEEEFRFCYAELIAAIEAAREDGKWTTAVTYEPIYGRAILDLLLNRLKPELEKEGYSVSLRTSGRSPEFVVCFE